MVLQADSISPESISQLAPRYAGSSCGAGCCGDIRTVCGGCLGTAGEIERLQFGHEGDAALMLEAVPPACLVIVPLRGVASEGEEFADMFGPVIEVEDRHDSMGQSREDGFDQTALQFDVITVFSMPGPLAPHRLGHTLHRRG